MNADSENELHVSRKMDAPRELVFKCFAESEHLSRWWGPKGMTMTISKFNFAEEGILLYAVHAAGKEATWGKFVYQEIKRPALIAFISSFSDETGKIVRAPFNANWPLEIYNTWTFEDTEKATGVSIRSKPYGVTEEEQKTFTAAIENMRQGFEETLNQLQTYIASLL